MIPLPRSGIPAHDDVALCECLLEILRDQAADFCACR